MTVIAARWRGGRLPLGPSGLYERLDIYAQC